METTSVQFWNNFYLNKEMPWDFNGIWEATEEFIQRTHPAGSILIPGCGSGHEIKAFSRAGWKVTALDFSEKAVELARKNSEDLDAEIHLGDFFTFDFGNRKFDFVYDRRFLCALPPSIWNQYTEFVWKLLRDDGKLVGIFLYGNNVKPGPPFPITEKQSEEIFANHFVCTMTRTVQDSGAVFNLDLWQEWNKKPQISDIKNVYFPSKKSCFLSQKCARIKAHV